MSTNKLTSVTTAVVDLLEPLESTERVKVMTAAFTLLGEDLASPIHKKPDGDGFEEDNVAISKQGSMWMKQNAISGDQLQQVFHISDGKAEVIASEIPGKDTKAKTINAYLLSGISNLLTSGDSSFDDKTARTLCKNSGCYSEANHSSYLKAKGNKLTGTKDSGWKLTAPGLKIGADLVKEIAG